MRTLLPPVGWGMQWWSRMNKDGQGKACGIKITEEFCNSYNLYIGDQPSSMDLGLGMWAGFHEDQEKMNLDKPSRPLLSIWLQLASARYCKRLLLTLYHTPATVFCYLCHNLRFTRHKTNENKTQNSYTCFSMHHKSFTMSISCCIRNMPSLIITVW